MKKASKAGPVFSKWCCRSSPIFTYKNPLLLALGHFRSIHLSVYLGLMFAFSVPTMCTRNMFRYTLEKWQPTCTCLVCRTNETYMPAFFFYLSTSCIIALSSIQKTTQNYQYICNFKAFC